MLKYRLLNRIRSGATSNKILYGQVKLVNSVIEIIGENNEVVINDGCIISSSTLYIRGNNNRIEFGKNVKFHSSQVSAKEDNNLVVLGRDTTVVEKVDITCMEGSSIYIGEDCMFSSDIMIRSGDGHSILANGSRINGSTDIKIGRHCWIGYRAVILKGVQLPDNTVVGAGSIVTKGPSEKGTIIAGNPAAIIKENITWSRDRI